MNDIQKILADMREQVTYTDKVTMPIPLYERIKEALQPPSSGSVAEAVKYIQDDIKLGLHECGDREKHLETLITAATANEVPSVTVEEMESFFYQAAFHAGCQMPITPVSIGIADKFKERFPNGLKIIAEKGGEG
jgi:hypothetical protein